MYKYKYMYNLDNYLAQVLETFFCLLPYYFLFFCRDSAVFIFPALLATSCKDPIQNRDRVPAPCGQSYI